MPTTLQEPRKIGGRRLRRNQDRLDREAERAARLGMSYGKYKALQREGRLPAGALATEEEPEEIEAPEPAPAPARDPRPVAGKSKTREKPTPRPCANCGEVFTPKAYNGRYCGPACCHDAEMKRQADRRRRLRAEARA